LKGARTTEHATETGKIKFKLRICVILFCTVSDIDPHVSRVCLELKWAVLGVDCKQLISMSMNNKETKVLSKYKEWLTTTGYLMNRKLYYQV
jgi:hypothetical protein